MEALAKKPRCRLALVMSSPHSAVKREGGGFEGQFRMEHAIYLVTLVGTALVVAAAFSSLIAFRFGAPLLLLFLCIGLA
ncbi:MAG: hypothetical protein E5W93_13900, partial [Mesorhizobium sp.]